MKKIEGGDRIIIEEGMNLLALIMIEGYYKSIEYDKLNNIYNPIAAAKWDYQRLKKELTDKLKHNHSGFFSQYLSSEIYTWK